MVTETHAGEAHRLEPVNWRSVGVKCTDRLQGAMHSQCKCMAAQCNLHCTLQCAGGEQTRARLCAAQIALRCAVGRQ